MVSHSKSKSKMESWSDEHTWEAVVQLLEYCSDYLNQVYLHEEVRVYDASVDGKKQLYRASPHKEGKPWYDWAIFDLSEPESPTIHDRIPCHIKCIVDLTSLPMEAEEGIGKAADVYCIVEPAYKNDKREELHRSEFWESHLKKPSADPDQSTTKHKIVVIPITKVRGPATVVPDLGNTNKRAFLKPLRPNLWAGLFKGWLRQPHRRAYERKEPHKTKQERAQQQPNPT